MSDPTGAICVHAFYPDVFEEILSRIAALDMTEEIFVSCPRERESETRRLLDAAGLDARILIVDNLGMDILPFLRTVREFGLTDRARVLKLHTKNPSRRGRMHMGLMLNAALGDQRLAEQVRAAFAQNPRLAQIGAELLYRPSDLSAHGNRRLMGEILQDVLGRPAALQSGFFVGSTFWSAGSALAPLLAGLDRLEAMAREEP
ncbi:MAG: rhamnan synthesis F family protein, partial [Paracoccaceae bacterium]